MTATELYQCDITVRALIDTWVRERRCPLPLADRFTELDGPVKAACALWAATEPDRPVFAPQTAMGELSSPCGPYPTMNNMKEPEETFFSWFWSDDSELYASAVNGAKMDRDPTEARNQLPIDAIFWLIDHWKE